MASLNWQVRVLHLFYYGDTVLRAREHKVHETASIACRYNVRSALMSHRGKEGGGVDSDNIVDLETAECPVREKVRVTARNQFIPDPRGRCGFL